MSESDSEPLSFMMGEFEALFPTDRLYAKNHMWAKTVDGQAGSFDRVVKDESEPRSLRFGFTAYAVRLLQDVYFLDWTVDAGASLPEKADIGSIESKKAESDLFAPVSGTLDEFNNVLLSDPSLINVDKYETGWLFQMTGEPSALLTPDEYLNHLTAVWEITQRTIKGQLNS